MSIQGKYQGYTLTEEDNLKINTLKNILTGVFLSLNVGKMVALTSMSELILHALAEHSKNKQDYLDICDIFYKSYMRRIAEMQAEKIIEAHKTIKDLIKNNPEELKQRYEQMQSAVQIKFMDEIDFRHEQEKLKQSQTKH